METAGGNAESVPGYAVPDRAVLAGADLGAAVAAFLDSRGNRHPLCRHRPARCFAAVARLAPCGRSGLTRPSPSALALCTVSSACACPAPRPPAAPGRTSGLAHRPLTASRDRLAVGSGDAFAEAIWQRHRARARATLKHLRVGLPAAAGRPARSLCLAGPRRHSACSGSHRRLERCARPFRPGFPAGLRGGPADPVSVEAWFTADYTGQPAYVHAGA